MLYMYRSCIYFTCILVVVHVLHVSYISCVLGLIVPMCLPPTNASQQTACNYQYKRCTCNSCLMVFTVYGICTARGLYVQVYFRGRSPRKYIQYEGGTYPMHCKNHETAVLYNRPHKATARARMSIQVRTVR